jgi:surface protein
MSVLSNRYFKAKPPTPSGYQRPSDWLTLPTVTDTDDTFVGLYAIFPSGNNFAAFRFTTDTGDYQVDWGDGTIDTVASNVVAEHTYDYSTYDPTDATLSSRGYKQAIIVVTPVSGELRTANFQFRRTTTPAQNQAYATGFLDCVLSMPFADSGASIVFGGTTVRHSYCEQFSIKEFGNCTILSNLFNACGALQSLSLADTNNVNAMTGMFNSCNALQSVPLFDTSNVTIMTNMFLLCRSLQTVPLFDTSNVTNMTNMFNGCQSLQSVPLFDTSSVEVFNQMFISCNSLQSVPLFDTSSATSFNSMFNGCISIQEIPAFNTSSVTNMINFASGCNSLDRTDIICPVSVTFSNCQHSQAELVNIFNNLVDRSATTAANINISGNWGASALTTAERDIALNKNWTITG